MQATASEFNKSHNSFSGVDIKAVMAGKAVGTLQGISYSVSREKAPIYTMGEADARGFARGKRGIAGSLVFIQFDTDPILDELANPTKLSESLYFQADIDSIRPEYQIGADNLASVTQTTVTSTSGVGPGTPADQQESDIENVAADQEAAIPWYPDQVPPIDIVLAAANEYGALAIMKILGVEILNGGYGVSIDDIVSEHSYTFIARGILPWRWQPPQGIFRKRIVRGGAAGQ
jgi:hypothetical protein